MLSPLYIAEIAPPAQRGRLVTYQQIAIVGGMVVVYFVNWAIAAQGDDAWVLSTGWRYMLASCAVPAGLFLLLLLIVPETPRWLVMRGRTEEAHQVLRRLTNESEARVVLNEIEGSLKATQRPTVRVRRPGDLRRHHALGLPAARRHQRCAVLRAADVPEHGRLD